MCVLHVCTHQHNSFSVHVVGTQGDSGTWNHSVCSHTLHDHIYSCSACIHPLLWYPNTKHIHYHGWKKNTSH